MNKNNCLLSLLAALLVATLSFGVVSCGEDDEIASPDSGTLINPTTSIADPEGTITLSMRNSNNGKTYLGSIFIENENFAGGEFAAIGAVQGLGNVSYIPTTGWADKISVIPGNGYVAYSNNKFYRIYVISEIAGTTGGVIGADIKYQEPFKGLDEAISLDEKTLTFGNDGGSQSVVFKNKNIILFSASADQPWCQVEKSSTFDYFFLYNAITIYVEPSNNVAAETATVTLTTEYGKEIHIKVTRAGTDPVLTTDVTEKEIDQLSQTFRVGISSNYDPDDIQVSSSNSWLTAKVVDGSSDVKAKAAQVKFIGEKKITRAGSENSSAKTYYLEVTAESNYNATERQGTITLRGKDGKVSTNISISQKNATLSIDEENISMTAKEVSSVEKIITTNIPSEDLQITCNANWLTCWINNDVNGKFYYTASANTTGKDRKAQITIKPKEGNIDLNITVIQAKADIYLSKEKLWFDRNAGYVTITVNEPFDNWEVENSSESWCTYSRNGDALTVRVQATETDREATIKFVGYDKELTIIQSKYATGDNYDENGVTGTVGNMQDSCRYVYKLLGSFVWSKENVATGANSRTDGRYNKKIITQIPNYQDFYPAFYACEQLNTDGVTGWYIPACDENYGVSGYYIWSSTEYDSNNSIYKRFSSSGTTNKSTTYEFYAVHLF